MPAMTAAAKASTRKTTRSKKTPAKPKTRQRARCLVADVEVRTGGKRRLGCDSQPCLIAPPKIERSREVTKWLGGDCVEWLDTIGTLAENAVNYKDKGPVLSVIRNIAGDLRGLVAAMVECLRTGIMPKILDCTADGDPMVLLHVSAQVIGGEHVIDCGAEEETAERLLAAAGRIATPLYEKAKAEQRAKWGAHPFVPEHQKRQAEEDEGVIRDRYVQKKLEQLRAKRDAAAKNVMEVITPELVAEIKALEEEDASSFRRYAELVKADPDRFQEQEVERRLVAEGLAPAEAS